MMTESVQSVRRADRLAAPLAERELDLLLVTELLDIRYLTGYTGSSGLALVGPERRVFITDFRYVTQAEEQVPDYDRRTAERDLFAGIPGALPDGPVRLGFDDAHIPVKTLQRLRGLFAERVELVAAGGLVERLRQVKDAEEVAAIRTAAALADDAFEAVIARGLVGRTERALALDLEFEQRRLGAEAVSFEPIVAAGAHGALPHAKPRDAEIPAGTLLVLDWGAKVDGYCSDCTRTLATGEIELEAAEVYALVEGAQLAALEATAPGPTGREVDAIARDLIGAGGHGEQFGHGLGHGVGLDVHEAPRLSKVNGEPLEAGNVVTIEPGVYLPGRFGVRIEDLVVLTETGHEVLSRHPKGLTTVS